MDVYTPDQTCPKCNHQDLRLHWMPAVEERYEIDSPGLSVYDFVPIEQVPMHRQKWVPEQPERLEIQCLMCFYEWEMLCADSPASNVGGVPSWFISDQTCPTCNHDEWVHDRLGG